MVQRFDRAPRRNGYAEGTASYVIAASMRTPAGRASFLVAIRVDISDPSDASSSEQKNQKRPRPINK